MAEEELVRRTVEEHHTMAVLGIEAVAVVAADRGQVEIADQLAELAAADIS
jgi:hypothetical protein